MYLFHILLGVCLHLAAVASMITAARHHIELRHEVNRKLPETQQLDSIFWAPAARLRFRQLQKELLPDCSRPGKMILWSVAGGTLFACAIFVLIHA